MPGEGAEAAEATSTTSESKRGGLRFSLGSRAKSEPAVRKSKSFKRIRGFLSGSKRKKEKTEEPKPDDISTIYNVDVDDRSVMTGPSSSALPKTDDEAKTGDDPEGSKKPYLLKVVLLLMDPDTRRFELLQLEFDSLKALVSDVLAQIPISVTEESLRQKTYTGITSRDGNEWSPEKLLANFCKGNDILVAVPTGVPSKECARLARPILSDDKVVSMLLSSGIDAKAWREKKKKRKSGPKSSSNDKESESTSSPSTTTKTVTIIVVVLAAIVLQVFHMYISAPIKPGHLVSPGIWLTKCGILAFLPSCENNARLEYTDHGTITLYSQDSVPMWELQGGVCAEADKDCTPGMQVKEDNTLVVGGMEVTVVKLYDPDAVLSPWPFAEQPNVHVRPSKRY